MARPDGKSEASGGKSLPRSIIVKHEDPRRYQRETIDSIFSDRFMTFLALLLIPIILSEFVVKLSSPEYDFLEICDWAIIVLFIVEYTTKLYLAEDRWAHFKSPGRLIDLVIIVIPFVQFLPFFGLKLTSSASLLVRLLRLPRVLAAAGRATVGREHEEAEVVAPPIIEQTVIRVVDSTSFPPGLPATTITWDQLGTALSREDQTWIDIYNINDSGFSTLGKIMRISEPYFKSGTIDEFYPHIDYVRGAALIFLQSGEIRYPERSNNFLTISRSGFVILCSGNKLVTISKHAVDLLDKVLKRSPNEFANVGDSFVVSVLYEVMDSLLRQYRSLLSEIELEVIKIGDIPRSRLPRDYLERIYQLTKEVSRLDSNLVHFKDIVGVIISRQVPLAGFGKDSEEAFQLLQDGATYLKEISQDLVESLHSIIDLYINQESFETNRILKILAVVTSVAVIPAAVSGMLGMNLYDTPFRVSLWEIALGIGITVSFAIYAFAKLGWLKT